MPIVERRGMRALQIWCRRVTESYENVNIIDMSTSWRDGLAFCALIHHFRPSLIDYESLKAEDVFYNNNLAYTVAEEQLGIPSLLDPQDMVDSDLPDKFSIVTYVSQFYHLLKDEDSSRSPSLGLCRNSESETDSLAASSADNTPVGTPKSVPRSLFTSNNLILQNNKFSPLHSPVRCRSPETTAGRKPTEESKQTEVAEYSPVTEKKPFTASGLTISAVCQEMERKAKLSEEKES